MPIWHFHKDLICEMLPAIRAFIIEALCGCYGSLLHLEVDAVNGIISVLC